ncbi:MAG: hypothetical protein Harvfovirus27_15 [Harvfovirus sp.]|uniref:Uncharacterized protein n=1 Tax=Harvfovirus sp. TaxID=2487768 RepID=A0A3G5A274_9VIRU|nr:MAG: hypothetical protein Harvfovirus27_15 [Harvfovirus sp.]
MTKQCENDNSISYNEIINRNCSNQCNSDPDPPSFLTIYEVLYPDDIPDDVHREIILVHREYYPLKRFIKTLPTAIGVTLVDSYDAKYVGSFHKIKFSEIKSTTMINFGISIALVRQVFGTPEVTFLEVRKFPATGGPSEVISFIPLYPDNEAVTYVNTEPKPINNGDAISFINGGIKVLLNNNGVTTGQSTYPYIYKINIQIGVP